MEENKEETLETIEPTVISTPESVNEPVEKIPTDTAPVIDATTPFQPEETVISAEPEVAPVETPTGVEPMAETPVVEEVTNEVPVEENVVSEEPKVEEPVPETPAPVPEAAPVEPAVTDAPAPEAPKKKSKLPLILLLLIVLAAGGFAVWYFVLGGNGNKKDNTTTTTTENKEKASPYRLSGNGLEEFDLQFLRLENKAENVIYSPLSIKYALAMLNEGTAGESNEQIKALIGDYKGKKYTNSEHLSLANAIYIKDTEKDNIKDAYVEKLKNKYNAELFLDPFTSTEPMNNWIKEKTLNLIENAVDSFDPDLVFAIVNALGIDMDWEVPFTHYDNGTQGKPDGYTYNASYNHERFSWYTNVIPVEGEFENNTNKIATMEAFASFNNFDAVKELGDQLKEDIKTTYKGCFPNYTDEEIQKMVDSTIKSIDENYGKEDKSTEFQIYYDDDVKVFAKDLKEYDGVTLQYVAVMPTTEDLTTFTKNLTAKKLGTYIKGLKDLKKENFKDKYITFVKGYMPKFTYDYTLDLESDLKALGVTDVFTEGKADLSKINGEKNLVITQSIHKATIELTQYGIKAAAVTMMGGAGNASACPFYIEKDKLPIEEIDMNFNKPFLYIIRDKESGEVWFTGSVYNPLDWAKDPDNRY